MNANELAGFDPEQFAVSQDDTHGTVLVRNGLVDSRLSYELMADREVPANLAWQVNLESPCFLFAHVILHFLVALGLFTTLTFK